MAVTVPEQDPAWALGANAMADTGLHVPRRTALGASTDWRDDAACRDIDPELFFPVGNAGPALLQIGQAKKVCAGCPVRTSCLEWALATGQEAGVWGGTSEDERRVLRRMRQVTPRTGPESDR